jgi:hypothetical protein
MSIPKTEEEAYDQGFRDAKNNINNPPKKQYDADHRPLWYERGQLIVIAARQAHKDVEEDDRIYREKGCPVAEYLKKKYGNRP